MTLYAQIMEIYPELAIKDFDPIFGTIALRDDSDGFGTYIEKWEHTLPLPASMKLGK